MGAAAPATALFTDSSITLVLVGSYRYVSSLSSRLPALIRLIRWETAERRVRAIALKEADAVIAVRVSAVALVL